MSGLFTVLIAEKHYIDAIRLENKLFFKPFLENKDLAFCYWNPDGQSLEDSVPGLFDAVGRKSEWRAVIINNCDEPQSKQINPFDTIGLGDFSDLTAPSTKPQSGQEWNNWEDSWNEYYRLMALKKEQVYKKALQLPLQKLSTWLSFRATDYVLADVDEKSDVQDWVIKELYNNELNPAGRLETLEREQYRYELKTKEIMRREFVADTQFNIAYPKEIYCISKRIPENGLFNPDTYWNTYSKNEYSAFCDRNMYFDKMRFLVFDVLPQTHKNYRCDNIRFLSTLLIFATNSVPNSSMQSRKLYVLECESDDEPLCTLITSYDKKLSSTQEVIENEIERIQSEIPDELTDKVAESLFCSAQSVDVSLDDSCDFDALYAEDDFDLLPSYPESEVSKWCLKYDTTQKSYGYIIRQQRRAVKKGIDRLYAHSEIPESNISRLSSFQLDDIRDYTENAENEMIYNMPPDIANASKYTEMMEEKSNDIKKVLNKRITKTSALIISALLLILTFVLYLPFILTNLSSAESMNTALVLTGGTIGVLLLTLIITLIILKFPLISAIKEFNNTMHYVANDINETMRKFSKYFGILCNVRRGFKVQNFSHENMDEYTKSIRIRRKHQSDIRKIRAELEEEYNDFICGSEFCDNIMVRPYEYDFGMKTEYDYAPPFIAEYSQQIEFLTLGNHVSVPSGYITKITLRMEEIYDK